MANADSVNRSGPFSDFWDFVARQHDWQAWITKAAAATPLADLVLKVGPPWPEHTFVAVATVFGEMVIYVIAYVYLARLTEQRLRTILGWVLGAAIMSALLYLVLFARFVVPAPDHFNRVVVGYELKSDVKKLFENKPIPSPTELVEGMGRKEELVWTMTSLTVMRVTVLCVWVLLFAIVTLVFSTLVLIRHPPLLPPQPPPDEH